MFNRERVVIHPELTATLVLLVAAVLLALAALVKDAGTAAPVQSRI